MSDILYHLIFDVRYIYIYIYIGHQWQSYTIKLFKSLSDETTVIIFPRDHVMNLQVKQVSQPGAILH